jgi:branched-chain amino acid transport system ATP-binding protein
MGLARTFQIPRPFAAASVRENVAIGAMFGSHAQRASVDGAMDRADRYLELFGLAQHRDKPAASLTPIENKLLGMARALATQPKLLLLDESMAGMNPREIDGMIALLRRVRDEEHIAVVGLVEHIMRAVVGLAERVIVMHQGVVLVDEPTQTALSDPRVIDVYLGTSSHR